MVYSTGDAQVVHDPNTNAPQAVEGGQNADTSGQNEAPNQDGQQKPLVSQEPQNQDPQQAGGQNSQEKSQEVQALEQRLGYSVDQLGQEPQQPAQPGTQQQPQEQQAGEIDPNLAKQFEQYIEQKFGVPPDQIQQQFQELQQFKQQQLIQQQTQALKQEWGDAFDERMQQVKEYFNNRLTPEQQKALDNADGARLIWAKIQQENAQNQPQAPSFAPQQGQSPEQRVSQPSTSYMFTKSQLDKMSIQEYNDNIKNIEYAIANGLVNYNA